MTDARPVQASASDQSALPPQVAMLYRRVLAGDTGLTQVWFRSQVLDRYRSTKGYRVLRSDSAGRVRVQGGWTLDFGIADDDNVIHLSAADLAERLPAAERQHWLGYIIAPPVSGTFLVMRLGAGHCMDDGDTREWAAEPTPDSAP